MFGFVRSSILFIQRATHGKSARFHPDHFHADGRIQIDGMILAGWLINIQQESP